MCCVCDSGIYRSGTVAETTEEESTPRILVQAQRGGRNPKYPLKQKDPAQSHMLHLVVMLLYSPSIWKFLGLSFTFMTLTLLKITGQLFCRMFLNSVCLIFPHDYIQVMHFVRNYNCNYKRNYSCIPSAYTLF